MADKSKIEWTDASWSPIRARIVAPDGTILKWGYHCEKVSPGCAHCYAEIMNGRGFPHWGTKLDYKPGLLDGKLPAELCAELGYPEGSRLEMYLDAEALTWPLRKRKGLRVFLSSMTDVFARFVPDAWLDKIFVVMALAPQHTFQVLTKRADRMRDYCRSFALGPANFLLSAPVADGTVIATWPLPNVQLIVSVEDQPRADERIPLLLDTPAAVRGVSIEPLLGPVDLTRLTEDKWSAFDDGWDLNSERGSPILDWVIVGGESGPKARPMHPDWARSLRDQCAAAGVPFFFKQWGNWKPLTEIAEKSFSAGRGHAVIFRDGRCLRDHDVADPPDGIFTFNVGKHAAGRVLDGRTHDAYPGESAEASAKADRTHDEYPR